MCEIKRSIDGYSGSHNFQWLLMLAICLLLVATRSTTAQTLGANQANLSIVISVCQEVVADDPASALETNDPLEHNDSQSESTASTASTVDDGQAEVDAEVGDSEFSTNAASASERAANRAETQVPHPLSVEPSSQLLPKDRPSWIETDPDTESEVHRFVVASIPTSLKSELDSNLDATLVAAIKNYVNQQFGPDSDQMLHERLTAAFIQTNLVDENKTYVAEMQTGDGPLFQKWVMIEVTPEQRNQIRLWINQQLQRQRVLPLGLWIGGLLSLVGISHLFLRRNTSVPDNLKATQIQFNSQPVQLVCNLPGRKKSVCRNFGMLTAVSIVILTVWFITSPGNSSGKRKRPVNQRQEVELRFAPTTESSAEQASPTCEV